MATQEQIQAKREAVDALRQQIADEKQGRLAAESSANTDYRLQRLANEEASLKAELDALRSVPAPPPPAPAPAPAAESTKAAPADNKE